MKKFFITFFLLLIALANSNYAIAQKPQYDEIVKLSDKVYKVRSGILWGLVNADGNEIFSLSLREPILRDGYIALIQTDSYKLLGVADAEGNQEILSYRASDGDFGQRTVTKFYYVNPDYPFISEGYIAVRETEYGKWGYLNVATGEVLKINIPKSSNANNYALKEIGITGKGIKGKFVLDYAAPFSEGFAAVCQSASGWHHIDMNGEERFKDVNMKPTLFRSSVKDGKCVIFNDKGAVFCRETPDRYAVVNDYIAESYELKQYNDGLRPPFVIRTNGLRLLLNDKFQFDKQEDFNLSGIGNYDNPQRPSEAISTPAPVLQTPTPVDATPEPTSGLEQQVSNISAPVATKAEPAGTSKNQPKLPATQINKTTGFDLLRDIKVELEESNVRIGEKKSFPVIINITNTGNNESPELLVTISVTGTKKRWSGTIDTDTTQEVSVNVPAKPTDIEEKKDVNWTVSGNGLSLSGKFVISVTP